MSLCLLVNYELLIYLIGYCTDSYLLSGVDGVMGPGGIFEFEK